MSANLIEFSLTFQTSFSQQRKFGYARTHILTQQQQNKKKSDWNEHQRPTVQQTEPNEEVKNKHTTNLAWFCFSATLKNAVIFALPLKKKQNVICCINNNYQIIKIFQLLSKLNFAAKAVCMCMNIFILHYYYVVFSRLFGREIFFLSFFNKIVKLKYSAFSEIRTV